jgi:hypothetical protein
MFPLSIFRQIMMSTVHGGFQLSSVPSYASTKMRRRVTSGPCVSVSHLEPNLNLNLKHRTASTSDSFTGRLFLLILRIAFFSWQVPWKPPIRCQIHP